VTKFQTHAADLRSMNDGLGSWAWSSRTSLGKFSLAAFGNDNPIYFFQIRLKRLCHVDGVLPFCPLLSSLFFCPFDRLHGCLGALFIFFLQGQLA
jgi:hypothetical protein